MRSIMKRSLTLIASLLGSACLCTSMPSALTSSSLLPMICFQPLQLSSEGQKDEYLTPNIDRLAREGTLMLQQHVVSPVCTPSRYNVLTGNFGSRAQNNYFTQNTKKNGQSIVEFNTHILSTDRTLPALLKAAGYTTGMVGKDHVVEVNGLKSLKTSKVAPMIQQQSSAQSQPRAHTPSYA